MSPSQIFFLFDYGNRSCRRQPQTTVRNAHRNVRTGMTAPHRGLSVCPMSESDLQWTLSYGNRTRGHCQESKSTYQGFLPCGFMIKSSSRLMRQIFRKQGASDVQRAAMPSSHLILKQVNLLIRHE